jgi:predicted metalloenzyme YecM
MESTFIGKDFYDDLTSRLKEFVKINDLTPILHMYGTQNDIQHICLKLQLEYLRRQEGFPCSVE